MSAKHVVVRMYRIGFGDAFLLRIPTEEGERTVLCDCGRHAQTPKAAVDGVEPPPSESDIVQRIVDDVTDDDGTALIDVVIATHRHQDHVSGFASSLWEKVTVREVWMPWTEDPSDAEAVRIRDCQGALARSLAAHVGKRGLDARLQGLAVNSLSNERAMTTLHKGFSGKPRRRFLEGKMQTLRPKVLPGVRVHVLGPARDEATIRDMDPPAGQSYLRAKGHADAGGGGRPPFGSKWCWSAERMQNLYGSPPSTESEPEAPSLLVTQNMAAYLAELAEGDPFLVAVALEKAVNGTSLMLAFELGDAVLLFPGDAQWGTWQRALKSEKARALMRRTRFYKLGHHGSHNATPKEFVEELLGESFSAMAPVWPVKRFPQIPKKELMAELAGKSDSRIARADTPPALHFEHDDEMVETRVPID